MSKRRIFDIDFPSEAAPEAVPAGATAEARRGPMASAIVENADALAERHSAEAEIRAENDRLAHEFVRLKRGGLIVDLVPIDQVRMDKLTRDRATGRDEEIDELKVSIREIGLSNPIRVEEVGDGFELIQGFRRLTAYRELYEETGDPAYAKIPAGLVAKGEALEGLYRRMVDENLVRRDISFAEMAELARAFVQDPETSAADIDAAIATLYSAAGRQKRHYIRHFAALLDHVGDYLRYPSALPRQLGLDLLKQIEREPAFLNALRKAMAVSPDRTPESEVATLRTLVDRLGKLSPRGQTGPRPSAKTTFRVAHPTGLARCIAADGRLEMKMNRDFTAVDRQTLEAAVDAFLAVLDD